jgi:hypothetical protein
MQHHAALTYSTKLNSLTTKELNQTHAGGSMEHHAALAAYEPAGVRSQLWPGVYKIVSI